MLIESSSVPVLPWFQVMIDAMPTWVRATSFLALLVVAVAIPLGRLYCLIHSVRAAVRTDDNERGDRALKVIDKLIRQLSKRR
jgi:hypothetical protein